MKVKKHKFDFWLSFLFLITPVFHFFSFFVGFKYLSFLFFSLLVFLFKPFFVFLLLPFLYFGLIDYKSLVATLTLIYLFFWMALVYLDNNEKVKPKVDFFLYFYILVCLYYYATENFLGGRTTFYANGPSEVAWLLCGVSFYFFSGRKLLPLSLSLFCLFLTGSRAPLFCFIVTFVLTTKIYKNFLVLLFCTLVVVVAFIHLDVRVIDIASDLGRFKSFLDIGLINMDLIDYATGLGRDKFGSFGDALGGASYGIESSIITDVLSFGVMGLSLWIILFFLIVKKKDMVYLFLFFLSLVSVSQYSYVGFAFNLFVYYLYRDNVREIKIKLKNK